MPDKKISELVNLTSLATDDEFVVVDKGANATKRITATNLSKFPSGVTVPDAGTIGSASDPDAMAISSGGVVTFSQGIALAAGKGIDFSATANGSGTTTSELFDDYEEGTFTAVLSDASTGGNLSSTTRTSYYTKIGDVVYVQINYFNIDTTGLTSGNIAWVQGLPFTVGSLNSTMTVRIDGVTLPAGRTYVVANAFNNTNAVLLASCGSGVADTSLTVSAIASGTADLQIDGCYRV